MAEILILFLICLGRKKGGSVLVTRVEPKVRRSFPKPQPIVPRVDMVNYIRDNNLEAALDMRVGGRMAQYNDHDLSVSNRPQRMQPGPIAQAQNGARRPVLNLQPVPEMMFGVEIDDDNSNDSAVIQAKIDRALASKSSLKFNPNPNINDDFRREQQRLQRKLEFEEAQRIEEGDDSQMDQQRNEMASNGSLMQNMNGLNVVSRRTQSPNKYSEYS